MAGSPLPTPSAPSRCWGGSLKREPSPQEKTDGEARRWNEHDRWESSLLLTGPNRDLWRHTRNPYPLRRVRASRRTCRVFHRVLPSIYHWRSRSLEASFSAKSGRKEVDI